MFGLLEGLVKTALNVVVLPVAVAVDVVTLPASAMDPHKGAFDHTAKIVENIGDNMKSALEP